ncbi:hypothetical protein COLO4_11490 [Corchorus olitorius]|uniref:Uncharacterized protein n=1 Tax=Corchorus olitorius TaxID=93759 RepID=A0A1R3K4A6_9ROSI|nr:hypothetical protein COLO4_11490 [Corchorus olitorius]
MTILYEIFAAVNGLQKELGNNGWLAYVSCAVK